MTGVQTCALPISLAVFGVWSACVGQTHGNVPSKFRTGQCNLDSSKAVDPTQCVNPTTSTRQQILDSRVPLWPAALALWGLAVLSLLQHKEFRYVLTPFQLLFPYVGVALARAFPRQSTTKDSSFLEAQSQLSNKGTGPISGCGTGDNAGPNVDAYTGPRTDRKSVV